MSPTRIDNLKTAASQSTLLRRLARGWLGRFVQAMIAVFRRPPHRPPGHFYSPLTARSDTDRALSWLDTPSVAELPGLDLGPESQLQLVSDLKPMLAEPFDGPRYSPHNEMFLQADAAVYRAVLRHFKPKRVIEVGSGYSTALALDTADAHLDGLDLTCIKPYTEARLNILHDGDSGRLTLMPNPFRTSQSTCTETCRMETSCFIDSTHVAKAGSDVIWLFFQVLPRFSPGVIVHVHDVFWPFEYPREWLIEGRDWTEDYLLRAFLTNNARWEVLLFASWLWKQHPRRCRRTKTRRAGVDLAAVPFGLTVRPALV